MFDRSNRPSIASLSLETRWEHAVHLFAIVEGLGHGELVAFTVWQIVHRVQDNAVWLLDWEQNDRGGYILSLMVERDSVSWCGNGESSILTALDLVEYAIYLRLLLL